MTATISDVRLESADELVEYLRRSHSRWDTSSSQRWVYRGHASQTWELMPRARRADGREFLAPLFRRARTLTFSYDDYLQCLHCPELLVVDESRRNSFLDMQRKTEFAALESFAVLADELGLPLDRDEIDIARFGDFPTLAMGIAQHHGIPTCLLDWTKSPLVAAYFASESHQSVPDTDALAIYALRVEDVRYESSFRLLEYARFRHPYLHAQEGLFSWIDTGLERNFVHHRGRWPNLIDLFSDNVLCPREVYELRRILLPRSEVPSLRVLLRKEQVTKARLMPHFDNVTQTLTEDWSRASE